MQPVLRVTFLFFDTHTGSINLSLLDIIKLAGPYASMVSIIILFFFWLPIHPHSQSDKQGKVCWNNNVYAAEVQFKRHCCTLNDHRLVCWEDLYKPQMSFAVKNVSMHCINLNKWWSFYSYLTVFAFDCIFKTVPAANATWLFSDPFFFFFLR